MPERFIPPHGGYHKLLSYQRTEIKLTNIARASLEELLADYRDFLRTRSLPLWNKNHPQALKIRKLCQKSDVSYGTYASYIEQGDPETAANTIVCLIHQANYLLDQQLRRLEESFVQEGGLRERMMKARLAERARQKG